MPMLNSTGFFFCSGQVWTRESTLLVLFGIVLSTLNSKSNTFSIKSTFPSFVCPLLCTHFCLGKPVLLQCIYESIADVQFIRTV